MGKRFVKIEFAGVFVQYLFSVLPITDAKYGQQLCKVGIPMTVPGHSSSNYPHLRMMIMTIMTARMTMTTWIMTKKDDNQKR